MGLICECVLLATGSWVCWIGAASVVQLAREWWAMSLSVVMSVMSGGGIMSTLELSDVESSCLELVRGKVAAEVVFYSLFVWFVFFFFFMWLSWQCPGRFVLSGVCGNIFSPLSKYLLKGTDCANLFSAHLTWCIL